MAKVKNILRCYAMGMGIKEISNAFNLSRNTVRKYVRQFMSSGYSLDSLMSISELQLQELFDAKDIPDQTRAFIRSSNLPADVIKLYIRKTRESFRTRTVEAL